MDILQQIQNGDITVKWNRWSFSGGHTDGDWTEYLLFCKGKECGFVQDNSTHDEITLQCYGDYIYVNDARKEVVDKTREILEMAMKRDDKEFLEKLAWDDELPCDNDDISREAVMNGAWAELQGYIRLKCDDDTVTITKYGNDDFDIAWHNGNCSVRGTANDILEEFCEGNLNKIKQIAYKEWSTSADCPSLYYADSKSGMAVTNPWIDSSSRFELSDADAIEMWGMETVFGFCAKAKEVLK